jgi:hypothetical protein
MPSEQPKIELPPPRVYKYAITLDDSDYRKLSDKRQHLTFLLSVGPGVEAEVIVQRQAD